MVIHVVASCHGKQDKSWLNGSFGLSTDFIYPPFILSGENWVSTPVEPWCCDLGQETSLSPYLFSPSVIKE